MEVKPTAFARGNPPEERNGFYGLEQALIESASSAAPAEPIVAIVTYTLEEVVTKTLASETYPVVKAFHIEPVLEAKAREQAVVLRDAALKARTGVEQLELPGVDDEGDD